jgi:TonB family protein
MKCHLYLLPLLLVIVAGSISAQTVPDGPEVVAAVAPIFPPVAASAQATGDVLVDVQIGAAGTVSSAHAVAGHPLLKHICEVTARRWRFVPARGDKTERTARLTFTFHVLDKKAAELDMTPVFLPPYKIEITTVKPVIPTVTVQ